MIVVTVGLRADPEHALGTGAARGPRGRGRRPRAGQERVRLQAPVARHLGRDRGASPAGSWPSTWRPSTPTDFEPLVTFFAYAVLILGGLASYWGVVVGSVILWTLLEGTRFIELFQDESDRPRCAS